MPSTPSQPESSLSPISEFLVYPTPVRKTTSATNQCARILTSTESLKFLMDKEQKKKMEAEEKARKKLEREEKRKAKEEEKKAKEEAKKAKEEEKKAKEEERKSKEEARKKEKEAKKAQQAEKTVCTRKRKSAAGPSKVYPKRRQLQDTCQDSGQDTCSVCFGIYKDDIDDTGCLLPDCEWIQCNDEDCGVWSHIQCLEEVAGGFMCSICQSVFS